MGLPSKKRPKSEKRKRRASKKLKKINFFLCPKCRKPIKSHHLCSFCGTYAGQEVIKIEAMPSKKKEIKK